MTNTPTTIDTETNLSAVNSILGSIGQAPINTLDFTNPEISFIFNLLKESNVDIQNEGWVFNREEHVEFNPDSSGHINIPNNILIIKVSNVLLELANVLKKASLCVSQRTPPGTSPV